MSKNVQTFIKSVLQSYQCTLKMHRNLTFLSWWKRPWKNWSTYKGKSIFVKSRISDNHKLSSGWMTSHVYLEIWGRLLEEILCSIEVFWKMPTAAVMASWNSGLVSIVLYYGQQKNSPIFELFLEFRWTAAKIF